MSRTGKLQSASAAMLAVSMLAACASTAGQTDVVSVHRSMKQALSAGDMNGAVQGLSENLVFTGSPGCTELKPCVGLDQFQDRFLKWAQAVHMKVSPVDQGTSVGDATRVKVEVTWDGLDKSGVQRLVGFDHLRSRNGVVVEMRFIPDTADAQTAAFLRGVATAAAGTPYGGPR